MENNSKEKLLIIRLSSFGDIVQSLSTPQAFKNRFPNSEIHWVTKKEFTELVIHHPLIKKTWAFDKKDGLVGWIKFCIQLRKEKFTHVYDAHSNSRSHILFFIFFISYFHAPFHFIRRPKNRWKRFLFFTFRKKSLPVPFKGQVSFLAPLTQWGCSKKVNSEKQFYLSQNILDNAKQKIPENFASFIALVPSAAWPMKRWPLAHWKRLAQLIPKNCSLIILGGPDDKFCQEIQELASENCTNLAGELSLIESCAILSMSDHVISADTGLLHVADLLGVKNTALIGPTAFGYPSHPNSTVLEIDLPCKPCSKDGRGKCSQKVYQKCLVDITPEQVISSISSPSKINGFQL